MFVIFISSRSLSAVEHEQISVIIFKIHINFNDQKSKFDGDYLSALETKFVASFSEIQPGTKFVVLFYEIQPGTKFFVLFYEIQPELERSLVSPFPRINQTRFLLSRRMRFNQIGNTTSDEHICFSLLNFSQISRLFAISEELVHNIISINCVYLQNISQAQHVAAVTHF